jgi:hypothetical protein
LNRAKFFAADQLVSSLSNFLTVLVAGIVLSASDFGAFAIGGSLFGLALGATRMTSSERLATQEPPSGSTPAALLTLSVVVVVGCSLLGTGVLFLVTDRPVVLVWAAAAPAILLQDRLRFVALVRSPALATLSDTVWLACVLVIAGIGVAGSLERPATELILLVVLGPLAASTVLLLPLRSVLRFSITNDLRLSREELPFVADAFLVAAAVFVSLAIVGAVGDLASAGRARILYLVFQPLVSIAYAGRLVVLRSETAASTRKWPWVMLMGTIAYSVVGFAALQAFGRYRPESDLWRYSSAAFAVFSIGQCARAFHQGVADVGRRTGSQGLVRARLIFLVLTSFVTAPLVIAYGLFGFSLASCLSFSLAAVAVDRTTRWRSTGTPSAQLVGG